MKAQFVQTGPGRCGDLVPAAGPGRSGGWSLRSVFAAAAEGVGRLAAGLALARERRAAVRQLSGLSDRQLADIGLHRAQLWEVVDTMLRAAQRRSRGAGG
jgi:uncharacterized protein YjiS (DUF1127 family)